MTHIRDLFRGIRHAAAWLVSLMMLQGVAFALTVDRVLATVNSEVITLSDYRRYIAKLDEAEDRETVNQYYLKRLIEEKLILQEAKKAGLDASDKEIDLSIDDFRRSSGLSDQELAKRLTEEGITMAEYRSLLRENIMSLKLIDKEVYAKVMVGSGDITNFYESNLKLFQEAPERVLVKAIYLKLNENASLTEITDLKIKSLRLYAEIKKGESFEKLAMLYTDETIKKRDGVLGEFEKGMLIPALDEKIFSLREGEVSEPVWTKEGSYILKVVKRSPAVYTPLESVKDQIRDKIYEQKKEAKFNEWMKQLWANSSVNIREQ